MKPRSPAISVIVPTYCEPVRLAALLSSLARQDYPYGCVEILVIDDGSPRPLRAEELKHVAHFPLRVLHHPRNLGRAQARNTGLLEASGSLVVFLDSDMTAHPGLLRAHADAHAGVSRRVVIGDIRFAPELGSTALMRYQDKRGVHRLKPGEAVRFNFFVTGNSSAPRDLLLEAGLFDPGFAYYGGEDLELGYRLFQHGAEFHYEPRAGALHHHCRSLADWCDLLHVYGQASLPHLLHRHPELADLVRLGPLQQGKAVRSLPMRIALAEPLYWSIRALGRVLDRWWIPGIFLSYLAWASRTRGYLCRRQALLSQERQPPARALGRVPKL